MTITYELYTNPADSNELKQYSSELQNMINAAFDSQDRSSFPEDPFTKGHVIQSAEQILQGWGTYGALVVAYDDSMTVSGLTRGLPVATAGTRLWAARATILYQAFLAGKVSELAQAEDDLANWELCLVTSRTGLAYRGQGLAGRCISLVEEYVKAQTGTLGSQTKLWVTALAGIGNIEYYQRRGFVLDGELDDAPAGMWAAKVPFQIGTLVKTL